MAKAKQLEPKIEYSEIETGKVGRTLTYVTIDEKQHPKAFDYPVIRVADLSPTAQQHVLAFFKSREAADNAVEFGPRNRLAGACGSRLKAGLVAPSDNRIRTMLMELAMDMLADAEPAQATALGIEIKAANHDRLVEMWHESIKEA